MSYQKRSNKYNAFKTGQNDKKTKSPKEGAKVFFKFTKIFMFFSLFIFSMTGCVQSLIITTDTGVGKGFEISASENSIAPHISKVGITEAETKTLKLDDGTEYNAIGDQTLPIYGLSVVIDDTPFVNKDDKFGEESMLKHVSSTINGQNESGDLTMTAAYHGINEAFQIKVADTVEDVSVQELASEGKIHSFDGAHPSVLSSSATVYNLGGDTTLADLANIKFWKTDTNNEKTNVITFKNIGIGVHTYDANSKDYTLVTDDASPDYTARDKYRVAYLNEILKSNIYTDFLAINPSTTVDTTATKEVQYLQAVNFAAAQNFTLYHLLGYTGIDNRNDKNVVVDGTTETYAIRQNFMPVIGFSSNTKYRPVNTWSEAWGLGPFYGFFVYPIGKTSAIMNNAFPLMSGWESLFTIILVIVVIRLIIFALSFKSTLLQTKMQELQAKKAVIDAKYAAYKGNKQMEQRQKQEVAALYKKHNINPLSSLTSAFITMPLFLAIWRVIQGIQQLKATVWLGINFSATSWRELFSGEFQYLPLILLAAAIQFMAQYAPRIYARRRNKGKVNVYQKEAMKKNNKTQNIVMAVFVFMAVAFSAGIQIYWIVGGLWRLGELAFTNRLLHGKKKTKGEPRKSSFWHKFYLRRNPSDITFE